jgi:hypothetical protein
MRIVSLNLFLAAAVFAQAPPKAVQRKPGISITVSSKPVNVVTAGLAQGKICSIPLLNVMPRDGQTIDRRIFLPAPPNSNAFAIRQVTPHAPPCDDVKR